MNCIWYINIIYSKKIIKIYIFFLKNKIDQDDPDATPFWEGVGGKGPVKDQPEEVVERHPVI